VNDPSSPMRSSNYNHVLDAVKINFQLAMSDHGNQAPSGNDMPAGAPLGAVGLKNLGNTCFLNASLQCLSNTIPLTDYFLGYDYRSEINKNNVLGTGGKLVTAYAELIKSVWLGNMAVVTPKSFKKRLEKFAPQFADGRQHDAHEVLSFLLDGIVSFH
jgi:ubiquitin C-terminal hydrolase